MISAAEAAGISLEGLAAIAGVVVVVVVALLAPYWARLHSLRSRLVALESRYDDAVRREQLMSGVVARGFEGTQNALDFSNGVFERLLFSRQKQVDMRMVLAELHSLAQDVERAWAEAQMLTDDSTAQRSAFQQLANRLGDLETATFLERRANNGELGALERAALLDAVLTLRSRQRPDEESS